MLRITVHDQEAPRRIQFEGKLAGALIEEAERAWQSALESGEAIVADLRDVTVVDQAGRDLLERMHSDGAVLLAAGVKMRALVEDIETRPRKS